MSSQDKWRVTVLAIDGIRLARVVRGKAIGGLTRHTLVQLGVSVSKLDRDVSQFLSEETHSLQTKDNKSVMRWLRVMNE